MTRDTTPSVTWDQSLNAHFNNEEGMAHYPFRIYKVRTAFGTEHTVKVFHEELLVHGERYAIFLEVWHQLQDNSIVRGFLNKSIAKDGVTHVRNQVRLSLVFDSQVPSVKHPPRNKK